MVATEATATDRVAALEARVAELEALVVNAGIRTVQRVRAIEERFEARDLSATALSTQHRAAGWSVADGEHTISLQRHGEDVYCFSASAFDSIDALRKALAKAIVDWESAHSQAEPEIVAAMAVVEAEAEYQRVARGEPPTPDECPDCDGKGTYPLSSFWVGQRCARCHGSGRVLVRELHDTPPVEPDDDTPAVQTGENF